MLRIAMVIGIAASTAASTAAAQRVWQTGTCADVSVKRRMVDFGPGASGFGRPGSTPQLQAMADVRRLVIDTDAMRFEVEDTVPVGRPSFDLEIGGRVTFAVEKKSVYIRMADASERKLRLIRQTARPRAEPARPAAYSGIGGGHVVRSTADAGRVVTLEDGSRWEILPRDRYQTAEWELSANITVRVLSREEDGFGYELINTSADEGAVARPSR